MHKMDKLIDVSGRAKGGIARAKALSSSKRKEIARKAAKARWGDAPLQATHGSPDHPLCIGDIQIPCYVLEDGTRVLTQSGMVGGLGMKRGAAGRRGDRLASFVSGKGIFPFINNELKNAIEKPIRFRTPHGGTSAYGYPATILADICDAVLAARKAGALQPQQQHIADQCEILVRGFARVGIIALVDEATGYQNIRPRRALQEYLEQIIRKELAAWAKKFPDEFYENIYKLKGWKWPGMGKNRFSVCAHYTRDLVYQRLAPGLLQELEAKSPKNSKGNRKNKFHQWLTEDVGNPMLAQHLHSLIMFQRLAINNGQTWEEFLKMVDKVMPKRGDTLQLPLGDMEYLEG